MRRGWFTVRCGKYGKHAHGFCVHVYSGGFFLFGPIILTVNPAPHAKTLPGRHIGAFWSLKNIGENNAGSRHWSHDRSQEDCLDMLFTTKLALVQLLLLLLYLFPVTWKLLCTTIYRFEIHRFPLYFHQIRELWKSQCTSLSSSHRFISSLDVRRRRNLWSDWF